MSQVFDPAVFDPVVADQTVQVSNPEPPPAVSPGTVLDPYVFDTSAFYATYPVPFVQKVVVRTPQRRAVAGSWVPITVYIQEGDTTPGRLYALSPEHATEIQIYAPDGSIRLGYTQMQYLDRGIYIYRHQTVGFDPKGCYAGSFHFVNGDKVVFTESMLLFEVL